MVATIPVPIVKDLAGAPEEPLDHEAEVKDVVEIEEEKEEVELATEEQVAELNMKAALERAQEEVSLQNLTIAEPMQSRAVGDIVQALSKVHAHYRMWGCGHVGCTRTGRSPSSRRQWPGGFRLGRWFTR